MNGKLYWKQKIPLLILNGAGMAALTAFLLLNGINRDSLILILSVWGVVLGGYLAGAYLLRKSRTDKLLSLAEQLKERYLLPEVMEPPRRADDQVFYRLLKLSGKSMLEQVSEAKREQAEYREYIEQWIHEIKTPITAMKLICENHKSDVSNDLLVELEQINRYTEQALFYARSEHPEKDYLVREIRLFDVVHQAIAENRYLLRQCNVQIVLTETDDCVYSDEKWLCFILNQLIVNAVKYRAESPRIRFFAKQNGNEVSLCIADNGIGITDSDLPRIFEKGFTEENGRSASQTSTGIGLYLCKRLCDKLGIGLTAVSDEETVFTLSFHINDLIQYRKRATDTLSAWKYKKETLFSFCSYHDFVLRDYRGGIGSVYPTKRRLRRKHSEGNQQPFSGSGDYRRHHRHILHVSFHRMDISDHPGPEKMEKPRDQFCAARQPLSKGLFYRKNTFDFYFGNHGLAGGLCDHANIGGDFPAKLLYMGAGF